MMSPREDIPNLHFKNKKQELLWPVDLSCDLFPRHNCTRDARGSLPAVQKDGSDGVSRARGTKGHRSGLCWSPNSLPTIHPCKHATQLSGRFFKWLIIVLLWASQKFVVGDKQLPYLMIRLEAWRLAFKRGFSFPCAEPDDSMRLSSTPFPTKRRYSHQKRHSNIVPSTK